MGLQRVAGVFVGSFKPRVVGRNGRNGRSSVPADCRPCGVRARDCKHSNVCLITDASHYLIGYQIQGVKAQVKPYVSTGCQRWRGRSSASSKQAPTRRRQAGNGCDMVLYQR